MTQARQIDSVEVVTLRLLPEGTYYPTITRTGRGTLSARMVRINYNIWNRYVSAEVRARAQDAAGEATGPLRTIVYRPTDEMPRWLELLVVEYRPSAWKKMPSKTVQRRAVRDAQQAMKF